MKPVRKRATANKPTLKIKTKFNTKRGRTAFILDQFRNI